MTYDRYTLTPEEIIKEFSNIDYEDDYSEESDNKEDEEKSGG